MQVLLRTAKTPTGRHSNRTIFLTVSSDYTGSGARPTVDKIKREMRGVNYQYHIVDSLRKNAPGTHKYSQNHSILFSPVFSPLKPLWKVAGLKRLCAATNKKALRRTKYRNMFCHDVCMHAIVPEGVGIYLSHTFALGNKSYIYIVRFNVPGSSDDGSVFLRFARIFPLSFTAGLQRKLSALSCVWCLRHWDHCGILRRYNLTL